MTAALEEIVGRLEKATGPSRELDAAIWLASRVVWSHVRYSQWRGVQPKGDPTSTEERYAYERAPKFSASLDAAMTLVDEDCFIEHIGQLPSGWSAKVSDKIDDGRWFDWDGAPTPAIALCIAALRARKPRP